MAKNGADLGLPNPKGANSFRMKMMSRFLSPFLENLIFPDYGNVRGMGGVASPGFSLCGLEGRGFNPAVTAYLLLFCSSRAEQFVTTNCSAREGEMQAKQPLSAGLKPRPSWNPQAGELSGPPQRGVARAMSLAGVGALRTCRLLPTCSWLTFPPVLRLR
jgi:hypothetical protein